MPKSPPPYPPDFRAEAVRLVRSDGRDPEQLDRDLGCSAQAIRNWVRQADRASGQRHDGLTTAEHEELAQLRREVRVLRAERAILRQAAACCAKEATRCAGCGAARRRRRRTRSRAWVGCSPCPGAGSLPGAGASHRRGPTPMARSWRTAAPSIRTAGERTAHPVCMPSERLRTACVAAASGSPGSCAWPG